MALTAKMVKFCNEYLIDLNATQAALRAGYSEDSAGSIGSENLQKPEIQAFLQKRREEIAAAAEISPEWVIQRLIQISDRAMQAEPVMQWDYDAKALVETGEYKFDSSGANKATELIGKHLGMFINKIDVTTGGEKLVTPAAALPDGTQIEI